MKLLTSRWNALRRHMNNLRAHAKVCRVDVVDKKHVFLTFLVTAT